MAENLRHIFDVGQIVVLEMRKLGEGSIINMSSTSWMDGAPQLVADASAKAAVIGFSRSPARRFGPDGIRVNSVSPGWVMTERQKALWVTPEKLQTVMQRQFLKQEIAPQDVADMVLFLSSHSARMCTEQNLVLDAGMV